MAAADSVFPIIFQYLKPNEGRLGIAESNWIFPR